MSHFTHKIKTKRIPKKHRNEAIGEGGDILDTLRSEDHWFLLCSLVDYNSMVENYTKRKVTPLADILPQT
jgi:hypothetical protein